MNEARAERVGYRWSSSVTLYVPDEGVVSPDKDTAVPAGIEKGKQVSNPGPTY